MKKTLEHQSGGSHYKEWAIEPWEFLEKNRIGWTEGEIIAHLLRHADKDGVKDLKKVLHYAQGLLESRYGVFVPIDWEGVEIENGED